MAQKYRLRDGVLMNCQSGKYYLIDYFYRKKIEVEKAIYYGLKDGYIMCPDDEITRLYSKNYLLTEDDENQINDILRMFSKNSNGKDYINCTP